MAVLKCKMCGGDLEIIEGSTICVCEYCGTKQTVPSLDNEKKVKLFERANRLRMACEFDKAFGVYESIVEEFPEEAEAYWGLFLCTYGIEYVDDPATAKKIPTSHRSSFDSVMEDANYEMVLEYADATARAVYREEAKAIENIRKGIIEISSKEAPYDIFICYKETDPNGQRTIDSVIAQDVYDALTEKGYKVFFSRITLEDKLGQEYEPYIFSALHSSRVMLVFGTDYEYFNAVWVKNEWSRFLKLISQGEKKTLIPCYKDIDAYDMPKEFARLQAQDMGKIGAIQDLVRGIGKIIPRGEPTVVVQQPVGAMSGLESMIAPLLTRANDFLDEGDFEKADEFFDKVLDFAPNRSEALIGKILCEFECKDFDTIKSGTSLISDSRIYKSVYKRADEELKKLIDDTDKQILDNILTTAKKALANKDYATAKEFFEAVCDIFPSECYLGIFLCRLNATSIEDISYVFYFDETYENVIKHCSDEVKARLENRLVELKAKTLEDAKRLLSDKNFVDAESFFNIIKDDYPSDYYLGILLCSMNVVSIEEASKGLEPLEEGLEYENALSFCDEETKNAIVAANDKIKENILNEARVEFEKGSFATAQGLYRKLLDDFPNEAFLNVFLCSIKAKSIDSINALFVKDRLYNAAIEACDEETTNKLLARVAKLESQRKQQRKKKIITFSSITGALLVVLICIATYILFVPKLKYQKVDGGYAVTYLSGYFATNVEIPSEYKGKPVIEIKKDAFRESYYLETVTLPDSIKSIGEFAFFNCYSLTSINIPDGITHISQDTFAGCSKLEGIVIPDSVTSIGGGAFHSCSSLTKVVIPDSVKSIGNNAFFLCSSLSKVTIGDDVRSIGDRVFGGCISLNRVVIPDSVTSIGDDAFEYCTSLTSVTIPDSVTSIGDGAFGYCDSLTSVVIPDSVTSIGEDAFAGCSSLTIYCEVASKPSGWNAKWYDDAYYYGNSVVWGYTGK